jgi:hypothetical protein
MLVLQEIEWTRIDLYLDLSRMSSAARPNSVSKNTKGSTQRRLKHVYDQTLLTKKPHPILHKRGSLGAFAVVLGSLIVNIYDYSVFALIRSCRIKYERVSAKKTMFWDCCWVVITCCVWGCFSLTPRSSELREEAVPPLFTQSKRPREYLTGLTNSPKD